MSNEVGLGSSMHNFFTDFWIKVQTDKTTPAFAQIGQWN